MGTRVAGDLHADDDGLGLLGIGEAPSTRDEVAGSLFRALRRRAGMPTRVLARRLETNEATLALLESGELRAAAIDPTLDRVVERYAMLCGIDPAPLLLRLERAALPDPIMVRRASEEQVPAPWQPIWPELPETTAENEPPAEPPSANGAVAPLVYGAETIDAAGASSDAGEQIDRDAVRAPPWPVSSPAPLTPPAAVVAPAAAWFRATPEIARITPPTPGPVPTARSAIPATAIHPPGETEAVAAADVTVTAAAATAGAVATGESADASADLDPGTAASPARAPSVRAGRLRRRLLRAAVVAGLVFAGAGMLVVAARSGTAYCTAAALPRSLGGVTRTVLERVLLATTAREGGLAVIDLSRPECRKTDKLRTSPL
jgi:hypothetical protein